MSQIHPSAVVSPLARIGQDVTIGPLAIIEDDVTIGDGCRLAAHVVVKSGTTLGCGNIVGESAVVGGGPQHVKAGQQVGRLRVGDRNTIREFCTLHRAFLPEHETLVGSDNYLMVGVHVGHDARVGSNLIIANNTLLGGHVTVGDRAFVSAAVAVHQFCRIGSYAMVGGQAHVVRDVPPYVTVDGLSSQIVGLNVIGLRRNGFTDEQLDQLKAAYRVIYRQGLKWSEVLRALSEDFAPGPVTRLVEFLSTGKRGFLQERRAPRGATLKLVKPQDSTVISDEELAPVDTELRRAG